MSELQRRRAGRGRVRPPEDTAGNHKGRRGGSLPASAASTEGPLGECTSREPGVRRWWRKCERDWPQLNRRDRQHLLEYCRLRVLIERWTQRIEEEGEVVDTPRGPQVHPLLPQVRMQENRADRMVRDFAGTAGTRERARPATPPSEERAPVLSLLDRGKPT